jgi:death on curing protein
VVSKANYLTFEQVVAIHHNQIKKYGGSHGIRELSLLESAVYRSQLTFGDEELYNNLYSKAAALMHSLILNHPFIDGNKRTGIVSGLLFLKRNGIKTKMTQIQLEETALGIANKEITLEDLTDLLKSLHC